MTKNENLPSSAPTGAAVDRRAGNASAFFRAVNTGDGIVGTRNQQNRFGQISAQGARIIVEGEQDRKISYFSFFVKTKSFHQMTFIGKVIESF